MHLKLLRTNNFCTAHRYAAKISHSDYKKSIIIIYVFNKSDHKDKIICLYLFQFVLYNNTKTEYHSWPGTIMHTLWTKETSQKFSLAIYTAVAYYSYMLSKFKRLKFQFIFSYRNNLSGIVLTYQTFSIEKSTSPSRDWKNNKFKRS